MPRVHVLTTKGCAQPERLRGVIAVVVDAIFATTAIAVMMEREVRQIVPTLDSHSARNAAMELPPDEVLLVGEKDGEQIPGFLDPWPMNLLKADIRGKTVIYSTTNGTIALNGAAGASIVLAASPVNARAVAEYIHRNHEGRNIVVICAGAGTAFSLEDFYGAGCLVSHLASFGNSFALSDAANAARLLHDNAPAHECVYETYAGRMMIARGRSDDLRLVTMEDAFSVTPIFERGRIVNANGRSANISNG